MSKRLVEHVYEHSTDIFCPHRNECTTETSPGHWLRTKIVIRPGASVMVNGNPAEAAETPKPAGETKCSWSAEATYDISPRGSAREAKPAGGPVTAEMAARLDRLRKIRACVEKSQDIYGVTVDKTNAFGIEHAARQVKRMVLDDERAVINAALDGVFPLAEKPAAARLTVEDLEHVLTAYSQDPIAAAEYLNAAISKPAAATHWPEPETSKSFPGGLGQAQQYKGLAVAAMVALGLSYEGESGASPNDVTESIEKLKKLAGGAAARLTADEVREVLIMRGPHTGRDCWTWADNWAAGLTPLLNAALDAKDTTAK